MSLKPEDLNDLKTAVRLLEKQSFMIRLTEVIGKPLELGFRYLPDIVHKASRKAIFLALKAAAMTLKKTDQGKSSDLMHKVLSTTSGVAGGFIGLAAIPVELPFTTMVMLRSVADIARAEGENIGDIRTQLACIEVFALGGKPASRDSGELMYYAIRQGLAAAVADAAEYIAAKGVIDETAPALIRLIAQVASRFEIVVSEKVAAESLPIIGAIGGGLINLAFTSHFQNMAKGHFIVRRLERSYGTEAVHRAYAAIKEDSA